MEADNPIYAKFSMKKRLFFDCHCQYPINKKKVRIKLLSIRAFFVSFFTADPLFQAVIEYGGDYMVCAVAGLCHEDLTSYG